MAVKAEVKIVDEVTDEKRTIRLEERRTPELVIAFVGPVGSGVTSSSRFFEEILEKEYGYQSFYYKVSDIIRSCCSFTSEKYPEDPTAEQRIRILQKIGNGLRERFGDSYLAKKCIDSIATNRINHGGYRNIEGDDDVLVPNPKRFVHIIDSLKHPAELEFLRMIYGDVLTLVGVFAPIEIRRSRLSASGVKPAELDIIITTDEDEGLMHGQKVRDTFYSSDFFVRNDKENDVELKRKIGRFLEVIFNADIHTPTQDEMAMYYAMSAGSKSACMSRQVGASIYSAAGEQIGIGWNDVPKFGGALYSAEDGKDDHRCFLWGGKICHNDERKKKLNEKILLGLKGKKIIAGKKKDTDDVMSVLNRTDIRNLIEYSRSIHAEMEAILSVARSGKQGLVESTMYTSTFPCHNCARHIIAAGIKKVVYIEPYPKSLAKELHSDALSESEKDQQSRVLFQQFDGVAPKNIMRYFKSGIERKAEGKKIVRLKREAAPVFQSPLDGFTVYEQRVVEELHEVEEAGKT